MRFQIDAVQDRSEFRFNAFRFSSKQLIFLNATDEVCCSLGTRNKNAPAAAAAPLLPVAVLTKDVICQALSETVGQDKLDKFYQVMKSSYRHHLDAIMDCYLEGCGFFHDRIHSMVTKFEFTYTDAQCTCDFCLGFGPDSNDELFTSSQFL